MQRYLKDGNPSGELHAILVDVEVASVSASTFLWAYSRSLEKRVAQLESMSSGGIDAERTKRTVYLDIPDDANEILRGVLFSSCRIKINRFFQSLLC